MKRRTLLLRALPLLVPLAACGSDATGETTSQSQSQALEDDDSNALLGRVLFNREKFGDNDRTCATCHVLSMQGTINASAIQAAYAANPNDPLFRFVDGDDLDNDDVIDGDLNHNGKADPGEAITYNRLKTDATNRVHKDLPANVRLAARPTSRTVVLNRSIPSIFNTPGLDGLAMYDGRNGRMLCVPNIFDPNIPTAQTGQKCTPIMDIDGMNGYTQDDRRIKLSEQAIGAINAHFQPSVAPNPNDPVLAAKLRAIADFQTTQYAGARELYLRLLGAAKDNQGHLIATAQYVNNVSNDSVLPRPPASDADAVAGRKFFLEPGADPTFTRPAFCGGCHTGANLDTIPGLIPTNLERGNRFATTFSSFFNSRVSERTVENWPVNFPPLNPVQTFQFDTDGDHVFESTLATADPGLSLVTGDIEDTGRFRILPLWNAKNTAPYFHDSSARTLEEVVEHYDQFFNTISGGVFNGDNGLPAGVVDILPDEKRQIVAYLKYL